jgi:polyphosphate kinase 2 (PPK2 family)
MGFCSPEELRGFFDNVLPFEMMLVDSGIRMLTYYLDIDKAEQKRRLADRREDPLKQWKLSSIDAVATEKWDDYTEARDEMLRRTSVGASPWYVVDANDKKTARLNVIRHVLAHLDYKGKDTGVAAPDEAVVRPYVGGSEGE